MKPDGIWPVRRPGAENARQWIVLIATRTHGEHLAVSTVEPSQDNEFIARFHVSEACGKSIVDHQPGPG
jgi:hypothetical protein